LIYEFGRAQPRRRVPQGGRQASSEIQAALLSDDDRRRPAVPGTRPWVGVARSESCYDRREGAAHLSRIVEREERAALQAARLSGDQRVPAGAGRAAFVGHVARGEGALKLARLLTEKRIPRFRKARRAYGSSSLSQ